MGSAQFIKPITKTAFLKKFKKNKGDFIKEGRVGGVIEILYKFGSKMLDDLAKKLDELNKTASGDLIESMRFSFDSVGENYEFVFSLNDYYKWVDKGRPKGKLPPFDPINQWAKNKKLALNTNRYNKYGVIKKKFSTFSKVDRVGIVDAIRWGIYQKGIKPTNFFTSTVSDGRITQLSADLSKALGREVLVEIKEYMKEINTQK